VDIGASATKLVLVDGAGETVARVVRNSGVDYEATARECLEAALAEAGIEGPPARTVSTGYGRHNVGFADHALTEIHCHGIGCYASYPEALTIVDIGGQDNKVIVLDAGGGRVSFKMNRKCAAGTGSFIEEMALRLDVPLGEMDGLARDAEESVPLSSFCTVFAKTEILAHLRRGVEVGGIVRGAFESVVDRILEMDPLEGKVMLTGGVVAFNPTIREILAEKLGRDVTVPEHPQFTGALGAALTARRQGSDE
jgi:predicted CoA-substrate-specific enzyme activase